MHISQDGELFESLPITYAAGTLTVDLRFLDAAKSMQAPVIDDIIFRFTGSVSGITGGHVGEDAFKIFNNISMVDAGGEFYSCAGSVARVDAQQEYEGDVQTDPAAIASGATNTSYDFFLPIPFKLRRAHRPEDTCLELTRLTDGNGQIQITLQAPPVGVVNSGTVKVYCRVRDERQRELKSRLVRRMIAQNGTEYNYPVGVGASLRKLLVGSNLPSAAAYTSLSAFTSIDSNDLLRVRNQDPVVLKEQYRLLINTPASGDEVIASNFIPVLFPARRQKIGAMPSLKTVHLKVAAITGGVVLMHWIEDRSAKTGTDWMGLQSADQLGEKIREQGVVNTLGAGANEAVGAGWKPELVRRLPVKFRHAKSKA